MNNLEYLKQQTAILWEQAQAKDIIFPSVPNEVRSRNESQIDELIAKIKKQEDIYTLLGSNVLLDLSCMSELDKQAFYNSTRQFIEDAKAFDETLKDADIFQALRNIWIVLMLQVAFHKPIRYHRAIFAYSMLYPYSDNYLDAKHISRKEKHRFNDWFSNRLHGIEEESNDPLKQKIAMLIEEIEQVYPRIQYPSVYEGLYGIQNAQIRSQKQHFDISKQDVCDISIEKGGTSVVADGYLIEGYMSKEQEQFCMDFGFALQLADDIQDIEEDANANHITLASILKQSDARKALYLKSCDMLKLSIERYKIMREDVAVFIMKNCQMMMTTSVYENASLYSEHWVTQIKEAFPVHPSYLHKVNHLIRGISLDRII